MNKILQFTCCLLTPLIVGSISGIATATGINTWFEQLQKPFFNPPSYLFGPVWTILYLLMGVSLFLILQSSDKNKRQHAILIFFIQLIFNFAWSFLFFKFQLLGLAFIEILIIWLFIILMIYTFYRINKTAAWLQIPYLLWVTFASILNGAIWWLN